MRKASSDVRSGRNHVLAKSASAKLTEGLGIRADPDRMFNLWTLASGLFNRRCLTLSQPH
jgi:hypothetical protein